MSSIEIKSVTKCCADCDHGREKITNQLQKIIICKALPPVPIAIPTQTPQGIAIQIKGQWPTMEPNEECDYFCPKSTQN